MPRWDINFDYSIDDSDNEIRSLLIEIEANRRAILYIPLPPKVQEGLNKLNIIRAIRGTIGIEGTEISEQEVGEIINKKKIKGLKEQEVKNANDVRHFIEKYYEKEEGNIITEELIKKIHYETTKKCNYKMNILGKYRSHDVSAGDYACPKHEQIPQLMKECVRKINSPKLRENNLIRAIVGHFYLVSIHPFGDGNGRTSRGIEAFLLYYGGYNVHSFYSLANFYYNHREDYVQHLQDVRFKYNGDLTEFVKFSLKGFAEELESVRKDIEGFITRLTFRQLISELRDNKRISERIYTLILHIMELPGGCISRDALLKGKDKFVNLLYKSMSERTIWNDIQIMSGKVPNSNNSYPLLIESPDEKNMLEVNYSLMKMFIPHTPKV
ncbi:Fic family protein [candidate division WOR-3 bacterium]|nr:Fic family protein [candidate division WOR-3 bacterium]